MFIQARGRPSYISSTNRYSNKCELPEKEVEFFFAAHSAISSSSGSNAGGGENNKNRQQQNPILNQALENFRMAATNLNTSPEQLAEFKSRLCAALDDAGCLDKAMSLYQTRVDALDAAKEKKKKAGGAAAPSYRDKNCYVQQLMHEVVSKLFVGSYHPANDVAMLKSAGVTHVLCCINVAPRHPKEFKYLCLPADDSPEYNIAQHFDKTFAFIDEALSGGNGVLIHCGAGISRAPTVAAAYLIRKTKITADEAVGMVQKVRSVASPNQGFFKQLMQEAMKFGK